MGEPESDIPGRLRRVAEEYFSGNKSDLARAIDMKPSTFSKYTTGAQPPGRSVLSRLASIGININWLLHGNGPIKANSDREDHSDSPAMVVKDRGLARELEEAGIDLQRVPVLKVEADAGQGVTVYQSDEIETEEEWLSSTFIRREYNVAPHKVRTLRVRGNSMHPTIESGQRIRVAVWDGEPLWVDAVYVIHHALGGLTIKRWGGLENGHVVLTADNPEVSDRVVNRDEWEEDYRVVAWGLEVAQPL